MTHYLTIEDVVEAHRVVIHAMGFPVPTLASQDRLEGALDRPRNAALYAQADIVRQAAILAIAISQAQAFEDGNKRAGIAAMLLFLKRNDYRFIQPKSEREQGLLLQGGIFLEVYAFLSNVPEHGNTPTELGVQAFCLWLDGVVVLDKRGRKHDR